MNHLNLSYRLLAGPMIWKWPEAKKLKKEIRLAGDYRMDLRIPNEDHSLSPVVLEYIDH